MFFPLYLLLLIFYLAFKQVLDVTPKSNFGTVVYTRSFVHSPLFVNSEMVSFAIAMRLAWGDGIKRRFSHYTVDEKHYFTKVRSDPFKNNDVRV